MMDVTNEESKTTSEPRWRFVDRREHLLLKIDECVVTFWRVDAQGVHSGPTKAAQATILTALNNYERLLAACKLASPRLRELGGIEVQNKVDAAITAAEAAP